MKIRNCLVNRLDSPLGFSLGKPVFSWVLDGRKEEKLKESRITVYEKEELVYDSGWKELDPQAYEADLILNPRNEYSWKLEVSLENGETVESMNNHFETGKIDEEWLGKWIGCDDSIDRHPIFVKKVDLKGEVKKARLYICGLGLFEASYNGEKIGNEYLTPYCNDYDKWVQVITFPMEEYLKESGELSIELGNGWYKGRFGFRPNNPPYYGDSFKLIAELHIEYEDGNQDLIVTDESWDVKRSKIFFSNIYDGEQRDDTLEDLPIEKAVLVDGPKGKLHDRLSLPVKAHEIIEPIELIDTPAGEKVFDMGQNFAGIFELKIRGVKGRKITIQTGEVMQGGNFYRDNLRTAKSEYIYISDGSDIVLRPKFTFYGFRYVKVDGIDDLKKDDLKGIALYSDFRTRGKISCGNDKINQLISNVNWGMKSNFLDVPTDCPQRDERMGWTGDTQVFSPTALYLADCQPFYQKFMYDLKCEQEDKDGGVPNVIPSFGFEGTSAAWGDVATILPIQLYLSDRDISTLRENYPAMKDWVDYMIAVDGDVHGWRKSFHFGDWLALDGGADELRGGTDVEYVAEAHFLGSVRLLIKAAGLLNKKEDIEKYQKVEERLLKGIREEFFSPTSRCCIDTQTAYLLALKYGLSGDMDRTKNDFLGRINKDQTTLKTGFVGTPLLLETLSKVGRSDLAYDLLFNEDYPGWLYCVNLGATTIWERWNSMLEDGSVSSTGMNSFNHYAFGAVLSWIFERAAGFRRYEGIAGFREVYIVPEVDHRLGTISMEYDSSFGKWKSAWKIVDNETLNVSFSVPYGGKAHVKFPFGSDFVLKQEMDGEYYLFEQGDYEFTYHTDRPIKRAFSCDNTLAELLANPGIKKIIMEKMPDLTMLPQEYHNIPLKNVIPNFVKEGTDEAIKGIDMMLQSV